jgi:D-tyrosyl-tRNA(Tyr) deacylase
MILLGVAHDDGPEQARWLANKIAGLRIFEDDEGKMNRGLVEVGGAALVISQFTLYGDCRKGRRPSFTHAARPELAEPLCEQFMQYLREAGVEQVEYGVFGAQMDVEIHNDGPVTLILERD